MKETTRPPQYSTNFTLYLLALELNQKKWKLGCGGRRSQHRG